MTRSIPQIYSVSEREYRNMLNVFKGIAIAGVAATAGGLAGILANHFIDPETSKAIRDFAFNGLPIAVSGGFAALYGGVNYFGNRSLNR